MPFVNTRIRVRDHRTKLVELEALEAPACPSVLPHPSRPDPLLAEQDRSTRIELHRHRGDGEEWREDYEKQDREHQVSRALCDGVDGRGRGAETLGSVEIEKMPWAGCRGALFVRASPRVGDFPMAPAPVDDESEDLPAGCIDFVLSLTQDVARDVRAPKYQEHAV